MKLVYNSPHPARHAGGGRTIPDSAVVSPSWLEAHLDHPEVVVIESDEEVGLYDAGHIPGAQHLDCRRQLNDPLIRELIGPAEFAALASGLGLTPATTVVFYGDRSNWWAAYALWVFHLFGHTRTKILDGGRDRWLRHGRPWSRTRMPRRRQAYPVPERRRDAELRAFYEDALAHTQTGRPLLDVRSPHEFAGLVTHPPEYPLEAVLRAGHIPGAVSLPWSLAITESGLFRSPESLRELYLDILRLRPDDDLIVYCRIGERSSHSWFVLTQLLGFTNVRNYDGSWTEWGNQVRSPIEFGQAGVSRATNHGRRPPVAH